MGSFDCAKNLNACRVLGPQASSKPDSDKKESRPEEQVSVHKVVMVWFWLFQTLTLNN